jgi:hypothetical protein
MLALFSSIGVVEIMIIACAIVAIGLFWFVIRK